MNDIQNPPSDAKNITLTNRLISLAFIALIWVIVRLGSELYGPGWERAFWIVPASIVVSSIFDPHASLGEQGQFVFFCTQIFQFFALLLTFVFYQVKYRKGS